MTLRHQSGFTVAELLIVSAIFTIISVITYRLTLLTFGEDGHAIAIAASSILSENVDTTEDVDFLLAPSATIAYKSLSDQKKLMSFIFSTEEGCFDALMIMSQTSKRISIESINSGWLTFDPNTLPHRERGYHLITVCQNSLETEQPVEMTILMSEPRQ